MSRVIKVPRLKTNRHGVYCLRVYFRVGEKLHERQHSLGTKDPATARLIALQFNEAFERKRYMNNQSKSSFAEIVESISHAYDLDLSRGVMRANDPEDHKRMMEAIEIYKSIHGTLPPLQETMNLGRSTVHTPPVQKSMRFSEATAAYLEEKKRDNVEQTIVAKGRTYKDFMGVFGDLEINLINKPEIVQWKTLDLKRSITGTHINKRLGQMNDFFNWAIAHGHYTSHPTSPVDGLFISNKSKLAEQTESFEPFTNDEIKAIFTASYVKDMAKPDHYWCPLVALFSGARREELAALKAASVKTIDGVACFHIEKGKTPDARRIIPIHPELLKMGFLDYAQHVQSLGHLYLFPHLTDGANGRGKNVGRQFAKLLDKRGIKDDRKVFHSFRHTVITRLHTTGANPAHIMQIAGHSSETQGVHFATYTHDVGLMALNETLARLVYPHDFAPLKLKDPTFSFFLNRWKLQEDRKARAAKMRKEKTP